MLWEDLLGYMDQIQQCTYSAPRDEEDGERSREILQAAFAFSSPSSPPNQSDRVGKVGITARERKRRRRRSSSSTDKMEGGK